MLIPHHTERPFSSLRSQSLTWALLLCVGWGAFACGKLVPSSRTLRLNKGTDIVGPVPSPKPQPGVAIVSGGGLTFSTTPVGTDVGAQGVTVLSSIGEVGTPNIVTGTGVTIVSGVHGVIATY